MLLTVPLTVVAGDRPRIEVTDQCGEGACLTYQKWALPGTGSAGFAVPDGNRLPGPRW
ncbi:hypothetical protein [Actinoplanes sp. NPDC049599]|uniref:hypothetical protein n=1 Tax=Actinoplanes sp. NPDC049599 TaxID=3363903 RepID=UPI0037A75997